MMKVYNLSWSLITLLILFSCDQEGYYDAPMNNLANYKDIQFTDYNTLPADSYPYVNHHFTPKNSASQFLIPWLNSNYFSMDVNSTATIVYNFVPADRADSLNQLSQNIRVIKPMDYKSTWGQIFVESFAPSKPAMTEIPRILSEDAPSTNPFKVVNYNFSSNEPVYEYDKEVTYLHQDFSFLSGATWAEEPMPSGYFNKDISGRGRKWMTYVLNNYTGNRGLFAYCNYKRGGDVWFITEAVDLTAAVNPKFTFDLGTGYYKGIDCLKVLISDNYLEGSDDPHLYDWEDVSAKMGVQDIPTASGYPPLHSLKTIDLSSYNGRKVHIAIQYDLPVKNANYSDATLYVIDNLIVYETRDYASIDGVQEKYDVFYQNGNNWEMVNDLYVLQPDDYIMIGRDQLVVEDAAPFISQVLNTRMSSSTQNMVVVYKNSSKTTYAENYILENGEWIKEPLPPVIQKRDHYIYHSFTEKWKYNFTEDVE